MGQSIHCAFLIIFAYQRFKMDVNCSIFCQFDFNRNTSGLVERAQDFPHASTYGFLQALRTIPDTAKLEKVCICVPNKHLLSLVDVELRECSDNSFRNVRNGRVIKDIVTCMEINQILRTRQNLLFRLKYVPNTLNVPAMYHCRKMAIAEAQKQTAPEVTLLE